MNGWSVRIVSIAQNVPGPVAVSRLVVEGTTAIKIEPPWGDGLAGLCQPWYDQLHAAVRVVRLDLKTAIGIAALKQLLADSDVFLASQRPSALARLQLDAASLVSSRCYATSTSSATRRIPKSPATI
jgi:alpha-methylacyl-CoA racemase